MARKYETVEQLIDAYAKGGLDGDERLILDNDTTDVYERRFEWDPPCKVFSMCPHKLLRGLLDYVGIPWDEC